MLLPEKILLKDDYYIPFPFYFSYVRIVNMEFLGILYQLLFFLDRLSIFSTDGAAVLLIVAPVCIIIYI